MKNVLLNSNQNVGKKELNAQKELPKVTKWECVKCVTPSVKKECAKGATQSYKMRMCERCYPIRPKKECAKGVNESYKIETAEKGTNFA